MSEDESTSFYSFNQLKALSITPHVGGLISFVASCFIVLEILSDRNKHGQVYHRLMLAMSIVLMLVSVFVGMSTWPIPRGTPHVYDARGSEATCQTQGFFICLSLCIVMYNVALSTYYLLVIGYGRKERHLRDKERWVHAIVLAIGFSLSIAGLPLNLYNSVQVWCFIGPIPCDSGDIVCRPDQNDYEIYRWAMFGGPLWFCIIFITGLMALMYAKVRRQEIASRKWRRGTEDRMKQLTKETRDQATFYVLSFYITWIFPTITRAMTAFGSVPPFWLLYVSVFFIPLQGLLNFLIYMRPRYRRYQKNHPEKTFLALLNQTFLKTAKFWKRDSEDDLDDDMNPAKRVGDLYMTTTAGPSEVQSTPRRNGHASDAPTESGAV